MHPVLIAADLVAVLILVFGLFLPRHGRRELIAAYLTVNVGVLAVSAALGANAALSAGLGLGLFGVLSIIRLRSFELTQTEVAYYFAALTLGLLSGLGATMASWIGVFMALVLVAVFVGDHPALVRRTVSQVLVLDRAHPDTTSLRAHVERVLGGEVQDITVLKTDLVNDTTQVTVRYTPQTLSTLTADQRPTEPARVSGALR